MHTSAFCCAPPFEKPTQSVVPCPHDFVTRTVFAADEGMYNGAEVIQGPRQFGCPRARSLLASQNLYLSSLQGSVVAANRGYRRGWISRLLPARLVKPYPSSLSTSMQNLCQLFKADWYAKACGARFGSEAQTLCRVSVKWQCSANRAAVM